MNKTDLQKVRAALVAADNAILTVYGYNEALATLDRELAAPEQEPFCYVNVNAQGDVTRTIKREDKWCKTPLYRHPAHQEAQPVSLETVYETIIAWDIAGKRSRRELARRMLDLFAAPPSREWQGLTNEEIEDASPMEMDRHLFGFAHAISEKLRTKNTGER